MKLKFIFFSIALFTTPVVKSQEINNLQFPQGTVLNTDGSFGHVEKIGKGPIEMILIADVGFGWDIYKDFMLSNKKKYTMYAVTLPGSGNTAPLPMPPAKSSYGQHTALLNLQTSLLNLIDKEKLKHPVVVGNLIIASWLAINTAINYPDKIGKVIVIGAMPYATWPSPKDKTGQTPVSMAERVPSVDYYAAPKIFKPMTRDRWLKNLFQPFQYSSDTAKGNQIYQKSAQVMIPTMARYLCEFYTTDVSESFPKINVPVLVLEPGYDESYFIAHPDSNDKQYFWSEWDKVANNKYFEIVKVPDARLFIWVDQLAAMNEKISKFLSEN